MEIGGDYFLFSNSISNIREAFQTVLLSWSVCSLLLLLMVFTVRGDAAVVQAKVTLHKYCIVMYCIYCIVSYCNVLHRIVL